MDFLTVVYSVNVIVFLILTYMWSSRGTQNCIMKAVLTISVVLNSIILFNHIGLVAFPKETKTTSADSEVTQGDVTVPKKEK